MEKTETPCSGHNDNKKKNTKQHQRCQNQYSPTLKTQRNREQLFSFLRNNISEVKLPLFVSITSLS